MLDFAYILTFILIGLAIINIVFKNEDNTHKITLRKLLVYHFLFSFIFYLFTDNGGGDAWTYWDVARNMETKDFFEYLNISRGTYFLYALNFLPVHFLSMSFLANTMLFGLIGFIGFILFYYIALKTIDFNTNFYSIRLFPLVFFLPNLHFWSSGVGKDTIVFFGIALFVYGILKKNKIHLLLLSLILIFFTRPHITLFLIIGYAFATIGSQKIASYKKAIIVVFLIVLGVVLLPIVLEYAKIEEASIESFNEFSESKSKLLSREKTGSAIDVSSYPLPFKLFTFLFRPLFFDAHNVTSLLASAENFFLVVLTFFVLKSKPIKSFKNSPTVIKGLMYFLIIGTFVFSNTLGNLGIMLRMRNMFLPGLLIYFLWHFSFNYKSKLDEKS